MYLVFHVLQLSFCIESQMLIVASDATPTMYLPSGIKEMAYIDNKNITHVTTTRNHCLHKFFTSKRVFVLGSHFHKHAFSRPISHTNKTFVNWLPAFSALYTATTFFPAV